MLSKQAPTRIVHALVATALAAATVISFAMLATPAQAMGGFATCPSSAGCMWSGTNYTGARVDYYGDNAYVGNTWNDVAASAGSHGTSGRVFCIYQNASYSGQRLAMPPGYGSGQLGFINGYRWPSSNRWLWLNC